MKGEQKILIVEDEAVPALFLKKKMERSGFQVVDVVASGEAAIESAFAHNPDLILMDILLAGRITGVQAMREIRKVHAMPVIFLTGYNDPGIRKEAIAVERSRLMTKPYIMNDLLDEVRSFLNSEIPLPDPSCPSNSGMDNFAENDLTD